MPVGFERCARFGGGASHPEQAKPGLAFRNGKLYIAELGGNVVRAVDMSNGHISTVVGDGSGTIAGDGGPAVDAGLAQPIALRFDANENLFISEPALIRRVDAGTGVITTVGGNAALGTLGDKGAAVSAHFSAIGGMTFAGSDNLFVADCGIDAVRQPCGVTRVREIVDP